MYVVIGHHHRDDQSIVVEVVDEVCITFSKSDIVVLPLQLLRRPFFHAVDIGDRPLLRLPNVTLLCPMRFSCEVKSAEDRLDFAWGLYLRSIILLTGPPIVNVILEVPMVDEFLDLILEHDALLSGVTDVLMELAVFVLIPLRVVSTQQVRPLEYPICSVAMKTSSCDETKSV